jgi:hypothetical protein
MHLHLGLGHHSEQVVDSAPGECSACGKVSAFDAVIVRKWITIFHIPVIPYQKEYWHVCRVCRWGERLPDGIHFSEVLKEIKAIKKRY